MLMSTRLWRTQIHMYIHYKTINTDNSKINIKSKCWKFCVMFSNSNIELISYHGLVVERELWSGGSRVSFLCILLNDGVYTCNKHTVVTQEIREPPCYNVTFIQTLKSLCQYQENIKRVIKIFLFLSRLQSIWLYCRLCVWEWKIQLSCVSHTFYLVSSTYLAYPLLHPQQLAMRRSQRHTATKRLNEVLL